MIPGWRPCFQHALLWWNPRRLPMGGSMQRAFIAASRPSNRLLKISRARPNALSVCRKGGKPRPGRNPPRRSGPAIRPGYRRKPVHEVDEVLVACDWLAFEAMKPDTS